jgi:hypothetical protein
MSKAPAAFVLWFVASAAFAQPSVNSGQTTQVSRFPVRADGLAKAVAAFSAGGRNLGCYHVVLIEQGGRTGVAFIPDMPRAVDGQIVISVGPVPGCGRSVGYLIDDKGDITPAQMGRD